MARGMKTAEAKQEEEGRLATLPKKELPGLLLSADGGLDTGLKALATLLSRQLEAPDLATVFARLKKASENLEALETQAKKMVLQLLNTQGKKATEKGSLEWQGKGWKLEARPQRTGLDPKRVEASIRAKGQDPSKYMGTVISYELAEHTRKLLQMNGWTEAEVKALEYPVTYAIQKPKRVEDDTSTD